MVQLHLQSAVRRSFISDGIILMSIHYKPEMPETQSRPLEVKRKLGTTRKNVFDRCLITCLLEEHRLVVWVRAGIVHFWFLCF